MLLCKTMGAGKYSIIQSNQYQTQKPLVANIYLCLSFRIRVVVIRRNLHGFVNLGEVGPDTLCAIILPTCLATKYLRNLCSPCSSVKPLSFQCRGDMVSVRNFARIAICADHVHGLAEFLALRDDIAENLGRRPLVRVSRMPTVRNELTFAFPSTGITARYASDFSFVLKYSTKLSTAWNQAISTTWNPSIEDLTVLLMAASRSLISLSNALRKVARRSRKSALRIVEISDWPSSCSEIEDDA